VVSARDGDAAFQLINPIDRARLYRDMQKQLNLELNQLVASYRQDAALPQSVDAPYIVQDFGYGDNGTTGPGGFPRGYYRS